ncbi:MAG: RNA methyltransferase [Candidatus Cyclonatronum sp.]|uniref:TrmH family RNA methyltransferase n=1 Tax=Cyclonatronum sp. TaxID=3024185 RepID=UPI0025BF74C8|nr:RNA methyltransferase [Cyclonatronum sp.]MCH8485786.1 RNA methyltransferase [Cyclonatronum sp.]
MAGISNLQKQLSEHLEQFVTPERAKRMHEVLDKRTRFLTVILEDIYQPQNASAVLRSCDCFGVQDVFYIEDRYQFQIRAGVTRKAHQWLTISNYNSENGGTDACLAEVKRRGYKIAVMTPDADTLLSELPLREPVAFLFGTEKEGVSEKASAMADYKLKIPMFGFSESLNVSVSVALTLYHTTLRLHSEKTMQQFGLSPCEKEELWNNWLKLTVKNADVIEKKFLESRLSK